MSTRLLPAGKLPATLLAALLAQLPIDDPQLLLGPAVGEDAAVIDLGPEVAQLLVAKSDPITFATDEIGFYAVNVCANDLAVTGATPRFYLPTLLLPVASTMPDDVAALFGQIGAACRGLGITVAGGHSEITPAVHQPVVAGTMLGTVPRAGVVRSAGSRAGDAILLAGTAPVEGTSIIARERRADLLARGWSAQALDEVAGYLHTPGISVLRPALAAARAGLVTAMHDPTEGGIITGLRELATAGGVGLDIDLDAVPVPELAAALCAVYGLDPLGVIASGALLATCAAADVAALLACWQDVGWSGIVIGRVTDPGQGLTAQRAGESCALPDFATDEITKLFG